MKAARANALKQTQSHSSLYVWSVPPDAVGGGESSGHRSAAGGCATLIAAMTASAGAGVGVGRRHPAAACWHNPAAEMMPSQTPRPLAALNSGADESLPAILRGRRRGGGDVGRGGAVMKVMETDFRGTDNRSQSAYWTRNCLHLRGEWPDWAGVRRWSGVVAPPGSRSALLEMRY